MSGRLWSKCLSVWMGKSQRILAWSFLTTFFWFYPPVFTVLKSTQHIWPCILLRPHCCASPCTRSLQACCSCWWYVQRFLHVVCTTWIWNLAQCGRTCMPLPWCWGPAFELPWSEPHCLLWCCFYWAIDMWGPCLQLLTHLCARHHAEASHIRLELHLTLSRWLWGACIQPSAGHFLLSCWHSTSGFFLLGAQHYVSCIMHENEL